ncbi:MAG: hypothetical protein J7M14_01400, partial [Planctomycetes bacterium]|nr:hypothetical protein [Planctomycetota bacterium]
MKPARSDSLVVIWIAAVLLLWTACLIVLWGWSLDTSGKTMLIVAAATVLAISIAIRLPGWAARALQRVLVWFNLQSVSRIALDSTKTTLSRREESRSVIRLLAIAAVFAAGCGLCSSAAVYGAGFLLEVLAGEYLWSAPAWWVVKFAAPTVAMMPMALGISITFLVGAIVRMNPGSDLYATICREWLWGGAMACAALAIAWRLDANLLALSLMLPVGLLAGALILLQRRDIAYRRRRIVAPAVRMDEGRRGSAIVATFACLSLVTIFQVRVLGDVANVGLDGRALWLAGSLALLAIYLRRFDRKSRLPGAGTNSAAVITFVGALVIQWILAMACGEAV